MVLAAGVDPRDAAKPESWAAVAAVLAELLGDPVRVIEGDEGGTA